MAATKCIHVCLCFLTMLVFGLKAVTEFKVSVDGKDVTDQLYPKDNLTHLEANNQSEPKFHVLPRMTRNAPRLNVKADLRCLANLTLIRKTRRFAYVVNIGDKVDMTCHYCLERNRTILKSMIWYRITHTKDGDNGYKVEEVIPDMHDDESRNRITVSADHVLTIKKVDEEHDGAYYCQDVEHSVMKYFEGGIDEIIDEHDSFKVYIQLQVLAKGNRKLVCRMDWCVKPQETTYSRKKNLKAVTRWRNWGPCQECDMKSFQERYGDCVLQKINENEAVDNWHLDSLLTLFPLGVSCHLKLVERMQILVYKSEKEIKPCTVSCAVARSQNADLSINQDIKQTNKEFGKRKVIKKKMWVDVGKTLDVGCPGAPVDKSVAWAIGSTPVILDSLSRRRADARWGYTNENRIIVDFTFRLRIKPIRKEDAGVITCWSNGQKRAEITLTVLGHGPPALPNVWTNLSYLLMSFVVDFIIFLTILCIKHKNRPIQKNARLLRKKPPPSSSSSDDDTSGDDSDGDTSTTETSDESDVDVITIGKNSQPIISTSTSEASLKKEQKPRKASISENGNRRKDVVLESSSDLLTLSDKDEPLLSPQSDEKPPNSDHALPTSLSLQSGKKAVLDLFDKSSIESLNISNISATPVPSSTSENEVQNPTKAPTQSNIILPSPQTDGSDEESNSLETLRKDGSFSVPKQHPVIPPQDHTAVNTPSSGESSCGDNLEVENQRTAQSKASVFRELSGSKQSSLSREASGTISKKVRLSPKPSHKSSSGDTISTDLSSKPVRSSQRVELLSSSSTSIETVSEKLGWPALANIGKLVTEAAKKRRTEFVKRLIPPSNNKPQTQVTDTVQPKREQSLETAESQSPLSSEVENLMKPLEPEYKDRRFSSSSKIANTPFTDPVDPKRKYSADTSEGQSPLSAEVEMLLKPLKPESNESNYPSTTTKTISRSNSQLATKKKSPNVSPAQSGTSVKLIFEREIDRDDIPLNRKESIESTAGALTSPFLELLETAKEKVEKKLKPPKGSEESFRSASTVQRTDVPMTSDTHIVSLETTKPARKPEDKPSETRTPNYPPKHDDEPSTTTKHKPDVPPRSDAKPRETMKSNSGISEKIISKIPKNLGPREQIDVPITSHKGKVAPKPAPAPEDKPLETSNSKPIIPKAITSKHKPDIPPRSITKTDDHVKSPVIPSKPEEIPQPKSIIPSKPEEIPQSKSIIPSKPAQRSAKQTTDGGRIISHTKLAEQKNTKDKVKENTSVVPLNPPKTPKTSKTQQPKPSKSILKQVSKSKLSLSKDQTHDQAPPKNTEASTSTAISENQTTGTPYHSASSLPFTRRSNDTPYHSTTSVTFPHATEQAYRPTPRYDSHQDTPYHSASSLPHPSISNYAARQRDTYYPASGAPFPRQVNQDPREQDREAFQVIVHNLSGADESLSGDDSLFKSATSLPFQARK